MTTTTDNATAAAVTMRLAARAENVMLVRQTVEGVAASLGAAGRLLDDVKLAVTEACSNVVKHAYRGEPGAMTVQIDHAEGELVITVSDAGSWLDRGSEPSEETPGMGLQIMESVAEQFELRRGESGTVARLSFAIGRSGDDG